MHHTTPKENPVVIKTIELCKVILEQPEFLTIRKSLDDFLADAPSQRQYQSLSEKGRALHEKQHEGQELSPAEIAEFDKERDAFFANPIAKAFVEAQEQVQGVQEIVNQYVMKTYELGRIPVGSDFESGCCGRHSHDGECDHGHGDHGDGEHGCSCHSH
jgi:cell fate (sporulation/competence/biofilm development) regulator YlbF (YheA/YmcA/DUF963 family)